MGYGARKTEDKIISQIFGRQGYFTFHSLIPFPIINISTFSYFLILFKLFQRCSFNIDNIYGMLLNYAVYKDNVLNLWIK